MAEGERLPAFDVFGMLCLCTHSLVVDDLWYYWRELQQRIMLRQVIVFFCDNDILGVLSTVEREMRAELRFHCKRT